MKHLIVHKGTITNASEMRNRLWTRILLALLTIGAALGAMALADPYEAHADTNGYLTRLAEAGYTGPTSKWLHTGYAVCSLIARGYATDDIATGIVATTGAGIYHAEALEIMWIAEQELCYTVPTMTA